MNKDKERRERERVDKLILERANQFLSCGHRQYEWDDIGGCCVVCITHGKTSNKHLNPEYK